MDLTLHPTEPEHRAAFPAPGPAPGLSPGSDPGSMGLRAEPSSEPSRPAIDLHERLAGVIVLNGSVRADALTQASGRSLLDLPVDGSRAVMDVWWQSIDALAHHLDRPGLPVRVLYDHKTIAPDPAHHHVQPGSAGMLISPSIERDPQPIRGTAGLLRDVSVDVDAGDYLLVLGGAQVLCRPLTELVDALAATGADVAMVHQSTGVSVTAMLVRAAVGREINPVGYVDFKEQVLPDLSDSFDVRVVLSDTDVALPTREFREYLAAVRFLSLMRQGANTAEFDPYMEDWRPSFALVEAGARVDPTARVHDSVILTGATLHKGSVVVRSVVGPGATVGRGQAVADRLVAGRAGRGRAATPLGVIET